jgi:hypothetical protein
MYLGCVAVCEEHLEDSAAAGACVLSEPCADNDCLVNASVASTLPERSFLSPGFDDSVSQHPPVFHFELIPGVSERRLRLFSSLDLPFERLCVLRI